MAWHAESWPLKRCAGMHACANVCMYASIMAVCVHVCMYGYMYECECVFVHVCTYMHACIYKCREGGSGERKGGDSQPV